MNIQAGIKNKNSHNNNSNNNEVEVTKSLKIKGTEAENAMQSSTDLNWYVLIGFLG